MALLLQAACHAFMLPYSCLVAKPLQDKQETVMRLDTMKMTMIKEICHRTKLAQCSSLSLGKPDMAKSTVLFHSSETI